MAESGRRGCVVAVCGATGAVGEVLLRLLEERAFPVSELRPLASERSAGREIRFRGELLRVELAQPEAFEGVDFVFFAATALSLAEGYAPPEPIEHTPPTYDPDAYHHRQQGQEKLMLLNDER